MFKINGLFRLAGAAAFATVTMGGVARADGEPGAAAAPAKEERKFEWSLTMGATSDYIFRGISSNNEDPAFQPSINASYGIFYAGLWGSNITDPLNPWETDIYAGITPELGPVTFDFGIVYYWYPGADDSDTYEFKAGASFSPIKNLKLTPVFWYVPDQNNSVEVYTIEGTAAYELPACGIFTPTISGLVGYSEAPDGPAEGFFTGDVNSYTYWNVGLALAVENVTMDFRYWDTDIDTDVDQGLVDERFVFSMSVTVP